MADGDSDATHEWFTDENGVEWFLVGLLDPDDHTFDGEKNYVDDQGRTWLRYDEGFVFDDDDLAALCALTIEEGEEDEEGEDDDDDGDEEGEDKLTRR